MVHHLLLLRFGLWVVIELAILVFAVIAAWRHKRVGLWFLAAAVILAILDDALHMAWSEYFLNRGENITVYLMVAGYGHYAVMTAALCGWCLLAFSREKPEKRCAEPGAAPSGGPALQLGTPAVNEDPPSVS
jgi:hypothetical protein